jgi:hypothetical protein
LCESEEKCQAAKIALNQKNLGQRYVELYDCNDQMMQKVSGI